ncbi:universal stress protein [Raoultella terrigena]|uniref:Universal stress protein G n=1 Tax=Raoultella terrigena TaxID=577 RepID=A0A4U9D3E9_RAOTE|nr:universal stress protein [Raoultella terrigena]AJF73980.1 universal stress protein UspG [Raoultella ornithinolytica]ROS24415.1 universal stress protein G [Raoultella terrigena]WJV40676.1 universal stress protein [Raoultella terrigena]VTN10113.1 Universal stress protein G [Raoultella terrigena]
MYKNILVPVDVFEIGLADKALSHAQFLAQSSAGKIHLVHVNPLFSPALTRGFISDARKMEDYLVKNSQEKLAELVKKSGLTEGDVDIHVRSGNVRDEVTKLADELQADVVIIGSRNPNIQTHLLGSEAASIVRYAHVPVFVVR